MEDLEVGQKKAMQNINAAMFQGLARDVKRERALKESFEIVPGTCDAIQDVLSSLIEKYHVPREVIDVIRLSIVYLSPHKIRDAWINSIISLYEAAEQISALNTQVRLLTDDTVRLGQENEELRKRKSRKGAAAKAGATGRGRRRQSSKG